MRTVNIGILGLGTVGSGVVAVLQQNQAEITRRTGVEVKIIAAAVRNLKAKRNLKTTDIRLTDDAISVVDDKNIEIVLELMGGVDFAKKMTERAIKNGKHIITANKALIAMHGFELLTLAKKHQVQLLFEAAVAGGVPIIKALEQGLTANKINLVAGIINGTSNFILTKMHDEGADFDQVLKQAQDLGYAEADPTFDIEGIDAAHKLAILSATAFGTKLQFDKINTQGIGQIESEDLKFADELGYTIKHLGIAKKINGQIEARVQPCLIPKTTILANVNGVMNAVLVNGNAVGETLYYGAGAGGEATASAVIANIIDLIKGTADSDILGWHNTADLNNTAPDEVVSIFYLRLLASDKSGVLANITTTLAEHQISVEAVIQKQIDQQNNAHIGIITNPVKTAKIKAAVASIQAHDFIKAPPKIIFVEHLTN